MGDRLTTGMIFEKTIVVTDALAARHLVAAGGAAVFSTPEMVRFVEMCALEGVRPFLAEGQETVGTRVDIRHLAGTPVGMRVTARCTLAEIDRRRLAFTFEVHDELDKVGEGAHDRFIVDRDRQAARLQEKVARWRGARG
ncbi:MAG: thioesterase family protein [Candidatus Methylomirabilota bacterium]